MDVPQLSLDCEVVDGADDGSQLLLGHQWEVVLIHICLQQRLLLACIADNDER